MAVRWNVQTVSLVTILPLILIVGVMYMMTRSAKNKQRAASEMRNQMEPGAGVRTIGGIYAVVKEVNDETVLLEITDGVHAHFAKNAIGAVLSEQDFNRIVHGIEPEPDGVDADDAQDDNAVDADGDVAVTDGTSDAAQQAEQISLDKSDAAPEPDEVPVQDSTSSSATSAAGVSKQDGSASK
jgi:preprotein translocase subunit YajC